MEVQEHRHGGEQEPLDVVGLPRSGRCGVRLSIPSQHRSGGRMYGCRSGRCGCDGNVSSQPHSDGCDERRSEPLHDMLELGCAMCCL